MARDETTAKWLSLARLLNRFEADLQAAATDLPDAREEITHLGALVAEVRQRLELPALEEWDTAVGMFFDDLIGTEPSAAKRKRLADARDYLRAQGRHVAPRQPRTPPRSR